MAPFPDYTVDDLAGFSGRPVEFFTEFAQESLNQALFIVMERTRTYDYPTTTRLQTIFRYATLDLAFMLHTERLFEFDQIRLNPFASETQGTYSYSKSNIAQAALLSAFPTGIRWLDTLIDLLARDSIDEIPHGGSTHMFENDHAYMIGDEKWILGPAQAPIHRPVHPILYPNVVPDYYPDHHGSSEGFDTSDYQDPSV